jgi:REP element-mobilizing transposase RayT
MVAMHDPGHHALRRGRISLCGQIYLLTTVTRRRRALFADWETAAPVCALLHETHLWRGSQPLCWVLMPDHLHLLVSLGEAEPLSKLMQRIKALTARRVGSTAHGKLWSPGFHDRALRREEGIMVVARYVVMNPVRAGLVSRVGDYPFWDAAWI